ncbi:MAG TPA: nucleotide exchange factor GrpE [bacterium]
MKPEETEAKAQGTETPAQDAAPQPGAAQPQGPTAGAGLQADLDKARAAIAEQADKYLRLQAEFENYKKRILREQQDQLKFAQLPLLRDLTQVMDDLERALQHGRGEKVDAAGVVAGVQMVAKQMGDTFQKYGMVRVPAAKQPFDPAMHQAVGVVETNEVPENHVIEEFRPGYVLHERVVRPAMVTVSRKASGNGVAKDS